MFKELCLLGYKKNKGAQMIYFILDINNNAVKIGHISSYNRLQKRLSSLQIGNPHKLNVIKIIPELSMELEKSLHRHLERFGVRGEWFVFSNTIKKLIGYSDKKIHKTKELPYQYEKLPIILYFYYEEKMTEKDISQVLDMTEKQIKKLLSEFLSKINL